MDIYVGNLPYSITEDEVKELFEAFGEVLSAKIIIDRDTNRSKGFGFVSMANDDEGQNAIDQLNAKEVQDRSLRINEARPREERPRKTF